MTTTTSGGAASPIAQAMRRTYAYWKRAGWRATVARVRLELQRRQGADGTAPQLHGTSWAQPSRPEPAQSAPPTVRPAGNEQLVEALATLHTYRVPAQPRRRVSLVIDSVGRGHLFGGAGTALILAALLANRRGADLRIITRIEPPVPANVDHVWRANGITLEHESQFVFAPREQPREIDLLPDELVVTTSWWTTAATLPAVPPEQIVYLLQEDERMFYLFGDVRLRCENVLRREDIRFIVNTHGLLRHLIDDGLPHLRRQACSFEPAFPAALFHPRARPAAAKLRFVFYARPLNPRNLYFLGLEVITSAVARGVLDPAAWDIVFVGRDIPDVAIAPGCHPDRRENLSWSEYAELVGSADLGLSLMYTPHPSYPPLDLAASGAVVVTNRFGNKQDLGHYSANLICCDANCEDLVEGLARGVALARDTTQRRANFDASRLQRDWHQALAEVVDRVAEGR